MTLATVLAFARAQAQTDSNGLTDATAIIFANEALQDFHRKLVNAGIDASQTQEAYRDATAGQGTYLYPPDMLALKTIELNYTDTSPQNYQLAKQVDVANLTNNMSFGYLRLYADANAPQFDDRGDQYEIFPTPTSSNSVSQLIRLFYYLQPTQYTATTDTVAYPENLDTTLLGWRIAASYLYSQGSTKMDEGDKFNLKYEERVAQYVKTLGRGTQTPTQAVGLQINGYEF